jgi:hypothetical protein
MSFDVIVVWVEVHPICKLVIFCFLELNAILLRSVFVNPVFMREGQFAWSSNSPLQCVLLYRVRHVFYLSSMYTSWRVVWHYKLFDQCWSRSVWANWHSGGVHLRFLKNKTSWTCHLKFFTICMISLCICQPCVPERRSVRSMLIAVCMGQLTFRRCSPSILKKQNLVNPSS